MNNEDTQQSNDEALMFIKGISAKLGEWVDHLDGDIGPDVIDTRDDDGDDYEPHMHNDAPEGGRRFPGLDRRWLAIGITDLQKGLLALRKAAEGGGF